MSIKTSFEADHLKIKLGIASLSLTPEKQDELRKDLVKHLKTVFSDEENTPEELQKRLDKMEFVFIIWSWLPDEDFMVLLHKIPTQDLIPLLRYMKQKTPNLFKRVQTFFDESAEEEMKAKMKELDKIPAVKIYKVLNNIYKYLGEILPDEALPNLPPDNYNEEQSKTRFTDIAAYVKALPSVPPERGKVILECLSHIQKVRLSKIAENHKWKDYPDWFKSMEGQDALNNIDTLKQRMPPQPLWEEMELLEAVYNLMAPGAASSVKQGGEHQDLAIPKALETKAKEFLHQVGKLSTPNLQVLLKRLSKENLLVLIRIVESFGLTNLHEGIHSSMPAKLYQQLEEQKPKSVDSNELQALLRDINATIRKLKDS